MKKLRIAVIGAGHLGRIHARLLPDVEGAELVAIADPSPSVQRELIKQTDVPVISDYRKLLGEIDAAIVSTPTRSHFDIAEVLLANSIHTLIEKPVTDCPYQARQLVEVAEENDCVLSVGHVEQFNPAVQLAMSRVGQPKFIQATRASGYTYRSTDIGVVHDLMIHDIDLVNSAFPGRLISCNACGFSVFGDREDMAQARLQFNCGGVANLTASRCSFSAERNIQIFGTDGFAAVDLTNHKIKSIRFPGWMKTRGFDFGQADAEQRQYIIENLFTELLPIEETVPDKTNAILDEQRDWVNCIRTGSSLRNTGANAAEAVRIADQVLEQIESHRWDGVASESGPNISFESAASPFSDTAIPAALQTAPIRKAA